MNYLINDVNKVGVFWSSGLESTLLLLMCIEKYGKENVYAFTQKFPGDDPYSDGAQHYHYYARQLADEIQFNNLFMIETASNGFYSNSLREQTYYKAIELVPDIEVIYLGINIVSFGTFVNEELRNVILDKIQQLQLISMPFLNVTKDEIVKMYYEYGYEKLIPLTRTCSKNTPLHCGKCSGCKDRKLAFKKNGIIDPTDYKIL